MQGRRPWRELLLLLLDCMVGSAHLLLDVDGRQVVECHLRAPVDAPAVLRQGDEGLQRLCSVILSLCRVLLSLCRVRRRPFSVPTAMCRHPFSSPYRRHEVSTDERDGRVPVTSRQERMPELRPVEERGRELRHGKQTYLMLASSIPALESRASVRARICVDTTACSDRGAVRSTTEQRAGL